MDPTEKPVLVVGTYERFLFGFQYAANQVQPSSQPMPAYIACRAVFRESCRW